MSRPHRALSVTASPSSSTPPNAQQRKAELAVAVEFSQGPHSLKPCHPAPGRDLVHSPRVQQPGPAWAALHEPFADSNLYFLFFPPVLAQESALSHLICPESLMCRWGMASPSALPGCPQLLSPPLMLPACCQFPSAAARTLRQNRPFLAHFCNIWCSFPSAQGGGTQQEPCDGHQDGTGLAPHPCGSVETSGTAAGGMVRVR